MTTAQATIEWILKKMNHGILLLPLSLLVLSALPAHLSAQEPVRVDYSRMAFFPERWRQENVSFDMLAWKSDHVVFLTRPGEYDQNAMRSFVRVLDEGWRCQRELIGAAPTLLKQMDGKPTICALPKSNLSCGYGCGYVGATGIEVSAFYELDWPAFQKNPESFAHYYFYEMGRNFYVHGDRHSLFVTGFAVFMRYVCMDQLKLVDDDLGTRQVIEGCEQIYADSDLAFMDAFTNLNANEKGHRLHDESGNVVTPSDQPVMYATAMLKLRRDCGGDEWTKRFFHALLQCDEYQATDDESAMPQLLNWLVCASFAAGRDLSPVFADRWRMPLTKEQRIILENTDWSDPELKVSAKVKELQ